MFQTWYSLKQFLAIVQIFFFHWRRVPDRVNRPSVSRWHMYIMLYIRPLTTCGSRTYKHRGNCIWLSHRCECKSDFYTIETMDDRLFEERKTVSFKCKLIVSSVRLHLTRKREIQFWIIYASHIPVSNTNNLPVKVITTPKEKTQQIWAPDMQT